jgi:UDP-N-acetylglucosamine transferase subunit ALG13
VTQLGSQDESRNQVAKPLIFVTVGTAQFPWPRLMDWLDQWLDGREETVRCLVQTGHTPPPKRAAWEAFLSHKEMERQVGQATAVVTQAAAASVMLCKELGKKPIVVPRLRKFGEMIDEHQILFGRRMAADGVIEFAESRERFHELLNRALADPASFRRDHTDEELAHTVHRIGKLLDDFLRERTGLPRKNRAT